MHFPSALAVLASIFLFFSPARSAALQSRALAGEATFYGGNLHGGACSFSTYTLPSGVYGTALSDSNWDNSANCGACISVIGPGGNSITAMIVDECPGCGLNHLDLFPDAFAALAEPSTGVIEVAWSYVDCPITTPLQLHNKDGVSQYWFSMQVVNAMRPVTSLFVSTDGGETWTATERQSYNFFQYSSGFGTATVDVMIADAAGDEVIVRNVQVASGAGMTTTLNFGQPDDSAPAPVSSASPSPAFAPASTPVPSQSPDPTSTVVATTVAAVVLSSAAADPSNVVADPVNTATDPTTTAADLPETTHHGGVFATSSSSAVAAADTPATRTSDHPIVSTPTQTPSVSVSATWTTVYMPAVTTTVEEAPAESTETVYVYQSCMA